MSKLVAFAESTIRELIQEQTQRLIEGGFHSAFVTGNFGANSDDDNPNKATIWCNVNVHGQSGPGYGYDSGNHCGSLDDLPALITKLLAEAPLENERALMAQKTGLAIGYLKNREQLAELDAVLQRLLEPRVYEMLSRNYATPPGAQT